jgi:2-dehydro-3-deoxygluconokinase
MTTAISIGECMVELRPIGGGRLSSDFAGDALNTAVYLKRSAPEIEVAFLTATGDDSLSDAMVDAWRKEGLSDRLVYRIPGGQPALYLIETNAAGDRRFRYWRGESPAKQWLQQLVRAGGVDVLNRADIIYISGISLAILSCADREVAIHLLKSLKTRLAFDPNIRPSLWKSMDEARQTFEAVAKVSAIVLPSRQDCQLIYGIDDPDQQIRLIAQLTQGEIALTCDVNGCRLSGRNQAMALPTRVVPVVDTSGAGDSFNGAYLAARLRGLTPAEAATDGLMLSSRVVSLPGAIIPRFSESRDGPKADR